jgi:hypothetical protein
VIKEALTPEVYQAFIQALVDYAKGAPSCTSMHQPCDVSTTFRDVKKGVETATKHSLLSNSTVLSCLEQKLKLVFQDVRSELSGISVSADLENKITQGIMKIVHVLRRGGYLTPDKVAKGFSDCGQHILGSFPSPEASTVSYDNIMKRTLHKSIAEEANEMKQKFPQVVEEMRTKGHVSSAFLDGLQLARSPHAKDRDGSNCLSHQDCCLITCDDTLTKFSEGQRARAVMNDPQLKEMERVSANSIKILEKHTKKRLRAEENARLKQEDENFLDSLGEEGKKQEKKRRADNKKIAKQSLAEKKQRELQTAKDTLGEARAEEVIANTIAAVLEPTTTTAQEPVDDPNDDLTDEEDNQEADNEEM